MTTPAGWYPDPTQPGTQRFWDGEQWTEQRAPAPAPAAPTPAAQVPDEGAAKAAADKKAGERWALWIVVGIIAVCGAGALLSDDDDEADDGGGEYGARGVCEQFVEDRLKAPSTADFSDVTATESAGVWTVRGAVDSENSFGAQIRNTYVCQVRHTGGENWRLVDLQTSGN